MRYGTKTVIDRKEFDKKLATEPVYLSYYFEDCVLRSEPTQNGPIWYVKFKGAKEFRAKFGSGIVTEAELAPELITKKEYDSY